MLKIFSSFIILSLIFYGLTDYCLPVAVATETNQMLLGKFCYATNWVSSLSAATIILFIVYHVFPKLAKHPLRLALSISLPLEIFVCIFYWSLYLKNPLTFQKQKFIEQGIVTSLFTSLVQHALPVLGLILSWWYHPIYISRKIYYVLLVVTASYFVSSCMFYMREREWPYPFMNEMKTVQIFVFFFVAILCVFFIYEVLRYIENLRRIRRIKRNVAVGEKKNK